jgi:hypothetical protein
MATLNVNIEAPRPIGRPPLSVEEKSVKSLERAAAKREYSKKWRAEHKERHATNRKRSTERILAAKRFYCPACEKAYASRGNLQYHLTFSRTHIDESKRQPATSGTITNNAPHIEAY